MSKNNRGKELFSNKLLWTFLLMMMSAGASEQAVSQWTSTFAEQALKVNKTVGDLAGPMTFAVHPKSPASASSANIVVPPFFIDAAALLRVPQTLVRYIVSFSAIW